MSRNRQIERHQATFTELLVVFLIAGPILAVVIQAVAR